MAQQKTTRFAVHGTQAPPALPPMPQMGPTGPAEPKDLSAKRQDGPPVKRQKKPGWRKFLNRHDKK